MNPVCKNLEHFNSVGQSGFLENVSVLFTDKTDSQNPEKKRERFDTFFRDHCT